MVFCELLEPYTEDYGQRILRLPQEVMQILNIEDNDLVEVIFGKKRIGVVASLDPSTETKAIDSVSPTEPDIFNKSTSPPDESDESEDLPKPRGLPFKGIIGIDQENIYSARLDGEVRLSLGVNIGGRIEVDTILKPRRAKRIFVSVLGRDPQLISEEEKLLLFNILRLQPKPFTAGLILGVNFVFKEEKVLIQSTDPDGIVM
ncbi:MAG: hypothetical protein JSV04_01985, partial [Candidatus Heimdallarchaeota archaeon]